MAASEPHQQQQAIADPFAEFSTATPPPAADSSDDPLSLFGGTPAPSRTVAPSNRTSDPIVDVDLAFEAFAAARPPSAELRSGVVAEGVVARDAAETLNPAPSLGMESNYSKQDLLGAAAGDSGASDDPEYSTTSAAPQPARRGGFAGEDAPSQPQGASRPSHRVFEYLDAKETAAVAAAPALKSERGQASSRTSGPLAWSPAGSEADESAHVSQSQGHYGVSKESVAELGHRAAKALQIGTKWFMNASKAIAKDVHSKIEQHRRQPSRSDGYTFDGSSDSGAYDGGYGSSERQQNSGLSGLYYDWASSLSRMSPGSRAAALGAMDEGDRLEVQRIIDEAELGDAVLTNQGTFDARPAKAAPEMSCRKHRESRGDDGDLPPPPSYEEIMQAPPAAAPAAGTVPHRKEEWGGTAYANASQAAAGTEATAGAYRQEERAQAAAAAASTARTAAPVPPPARQPSADLLGMDAGPSPGVAPGTAAASNATSHIDAMFSMPTPTTQQPSRAPAATTSAPAANRTAAKQPPPVTSGLDSMIDLSAGLAAVDTSGFDALYADVEEVGSADEPEIRRLLRQRRIAEKHERMKMQLAEKRAREEQEDAEKAGKVAFRETLRPRIDSWAAGKKDNIRALLSSLHLVLWEGSGWTSPSIADLMEPSKVKRWYMKANLVVHPDKVKQKGGTLEQVATADMVFDVLKSAWGKFEAS